MFGFLRRYREHNAYTPRHLDVGEQPNTPAGYIGPATRYLTRTGAYSENMVRQWPTVKASAPVPNRRPFPRPPR